MPEDEEKMIKRKEEHPETGLSWFMKKKGYKMPPGRETVKAELRKIPGLQMPSKKPPMMGEEESLHDLDKEGLKELHAFFCWLMDKGLKHPGSPEEFEKLYNQFEVGKFAEEQKADPSMFEGFKFDPKPKLPGNDTKPPLTKKTVTSIIRKKRSGG